MNEYETRKYRCKVCGEQPALIGAYSTQISRVGLACGCTEEEQYIFLPLNTKMVFGALAPERWVVE